MTFAALLADGGTAGSSPWWVSGAWGLLGTAVGGVITFLTTRFTHRQQLEADREREQRDARAERDREQREAEAERERQRKRQVTDIAVRFIQAVSKQASESVNVKGTVAELQSKIDEATRAANPGEAVMNVFKEFSQSQRPPTDDFGAQLGFMTATLTGLGSVEPALSELNVIVAEMRLVVPNNIVHIAEQVSAVCLFARVAANLSALPLQQRMSAGGMVTTALNVFVNAVRHEVGMDYYSPKKISLKDIGSELQKVANEQRSGAGG